MTARQINRASSVAMVVLALVAFTAVVTGFFQAPQPDEGAAAHIFQISVVALGAALLGFLATADWTQPGRRLRTLALPISIVSIALAALFYLERIFYPTHYR